MKRHLMMLAALSMSATPAFAHKGMIHKMPRAPTGKVIPAPVAGVGEHPIPDNFNPWASLEASSGIPPASSEEVGAFRFVCGTGQVNNIDPVVYPSGVSPHGHQYWGNLNVPPNATYPSLRMQGFSTCEDSTIPAVNRSAYWMPAMLDGVGGVVKPYFFNIYYKRLPKTNPLCATNTGNPSTDLLNKLGYCVPIPNGLRFVHGYNMTTMTGGPLTDSTMLFGCRLSTTGDFMVGNTDRPSIKAVRDTGCVSGSDLHVKMAGGNCWDGVNLDTPNHRDHLTRFGRISGSGGSAFEACPFDHPYTIPELTFQAQWRIDSTFGTWQLTSDRQMGSTIAGETFHFDYHEAWSPTVKAMWEENCINGHLTCSGGDLGNGYQIKGANGLDGSGNYPVPAHVSATGVN